MPAPYRQSILLIGATCRSGQEILTQLIAHPTRPQVHVFCRNPTKLAPECTKMCASVYQGDARNATHVKRALASSDADICIISIGNGDSVAKSDIRTVNAQAVASAMKTSGMEHIRAVVLSSPGAGTSTIKVGMGFGKLIEHHLRHVLRDHTGQESAFLDNGLADRTVIVRATALTDGKASGKIHEFGDREKSPTIHIDRGDVAMYVVKEACNGVPAGKVVNITGKK